MRIPQSVILAAIASLEISLPQALQAAPFFTPNMPISMSSPYCIANPRNDRAAKRQRAAAKRRNKAKRG